MKYIRTKDGKIVGFKESISAKIIEGMTTLGLAKYEGSEVVRQSDNVEDLFDGIFEFRPGVMRPLCEIHRRKEDGKLYRYWSRSGCAEPAKDSVIRGGIWTERGLTYAAEMDKRGGWKLL